MKKVFKHNGDPTFSLEKYWAYVEAKHFKNIEQARKIFNEMILAKSASAKYSPVWLEFLDLEREFGDEKHQRRLLNRALNECEDKEVIFEILLKFEKQNGTIQQFSSVYSKYENFKEENLKRLEETKKTVNNKKEPKKQEISKPEKKGQQMKKKTEKEEKANNLKRKSEATEEVQETSQAKKPATFLKDKDGFAIPALPPSLPTIQESIQQTTPSSTNKTRNNI